ncbi:hypothetical protein TGVEG_441290 [Toxoplasma gondii VEG]|uniref:Uncharacterized protein n=1 Tax=Toxoplasma gondii (strain ATCC 50861 / VEG) TaxID=432359 RepID=V4YPV9_TOXGV|nr:hypothetical protein TGVEG_441290 [Toxoplasma gondii VEG]
MDDGLCYLAKKKTQNTTALLSSCCVIQRTVSRPPDSGTAGHIAKSNQWLSRVSYRVTAGTESFKKNLIFAQPWRVTSIFYIASDAAVSSNVGVGTSRTELWGTANFTERTSWTGFARRLAFAWTTRWMAKDVSVSSYHFCRILPFLAVCAGPVVCCCTMDVIAIKSVYRLGKLRDSSNIRQKKHESFNIISASAQYWIFSRKNKGIADAERFCATNLGLLPVSS